MAKAKAKSKAKAKVSTKEIQYRDDDKKVKVNIESKPPVEKSTFNTNKKKQEDKKGKNLVKKQKKIQKTKDGDETDELRSEILALGGDEDDLQLIKDAEEIGQGQSQDESFSEKARRELEDFVKSLGLDEKFREQHVVQDNFEVAGESEDDEVDDDEEDEEKPAVQVEEVSSSTADKEPVRPEFHFLKDKSQRQHLLVKTGGQHWHQVLPDCHEGDFAPTSQYWRAKLEKYAAAALDAECQNYRHMNQKGARKSEMGYIDTVLKSGAVGDKISALTVLLHESPVQNLQAVEALINMVSLKSRRPCFLAMEALKELFAERLLPADRPLRLFKENPFCKLSVLSGGNKDTRDKYLVVWWFEHKLKEAYHKFLLALDEVFKDTVERTRMQAMAVVFALLSGKPEREAELLERLVNKLGDPARSVASKAMHTLTKLLEEHPAMTMVVLKEVERVLYRPNVSLKAQYYGICFLSQIIIGGQKESDVANRLIQIYFSFFKVNIKKGDIDTKLMSALLTGVNRAFPYASMAKEKLEEQNQVMFRLVHLLSNFNSGVQALSLLYQVMDEGETASDRFYAALYRKLLHPGLAHSAKITVFLNLLYKAMKKDPSSNRLKAFIKRLLQVRR